MKITATIKTSKFKFLWLKAVTGFVPSHHCARCLRGTYSKLFAYGRAKPGTITGEVDRDGARFFYLCGVTNRWVNNLHVAFVEAPGEVIQYEDDNMLLCIEDARRLEITPLPPGFRGLDRYFTTCRNYQFGVQYFDPDGKGELIKPSD